SMLFAIIGMRYFNVSANLMSLGAIDFGLIVDGAVIIVENTVRRLAAQRQHLGRALSKDERLRLTRDAATEVLKPALFGIIIIAAYIPILTLSGIEGKMFRPMAFTVILALLGALVLSLTLIPALSATFLRDHPHERENRVLEAVRRRYARALDLVMQRRRAVSGAALAFLVVCGLLFMTRGAEFLPELDEGALAINHVRLKSVSLTEAVRQAQLVEAIVREFPEVETTVSRVGRPEIEVGVAIGGHARDPGVGDGRASRTAAGHRHLHVTADQVPPDGTDRRSRRALRRRREDLRRRPERAAAQGS